MGLVFMPMKTFKRMAFGIISSLLLTVGLARAAQQLDPLSKSVVADKGANIDVAPAPSCAVPCFFAGNATPAPSCAAPCFLVEK